jgi:hypothetical protein
MSIAAHSRAKAIVPTTSRKIRYSKMSAKSIEISFCKLIINFFHFPVDAGSAKLTRRLASLCTHPFLVPNAEQDYYEKIIASAQDPAIMKNKARDRPIMYSSSPARRRIRIKTPMERYDPSIIPQRSSSTQIVYPSDIPSLPEDVLIVRGIQISWGNHT